VCTPLAAPPPPYRPLLITLVLAAAACAASLACLIGAESANLSTVHTVFGPRTVSGFRTNHVHLSAGKYWIYEDPGGTDNFPLPPSGFTVTGPDGRAALTTVPNVVKPVDAAGPLLGVGLFAGIASFAVPNDGPYAITLDGLAQGGKLFVAEPPGSAARRVGPWILGVLASGTVTAWCRRRLRRLRRRGLPWRPEGTGHLSGLIGYAQPENGR
jgi:hypothetical protein